MCYKLIWLTCVDFKKINIKICFVLQFRTCWIRGGSLFFRLSPNQISKFSSQTNFLLIFSFSGLFSYYLITISVYIMYSNQAEASPIPATSHDEVDKVNFLNLQCESSPGGVIPNTKLSDSELRQRLVDVLVSCNSALYTTKHLTDNYVSFESKLYSKISYATPGTV